MATRTQTREETQQASETTSYPVYAITPSSNVIQQVINRSIQREATENTPLYFPE